MNYTNGVMTNIDVFSDIELKKEIKAKYLASEINNQSW